MPKPTSEGIYETIESPYRIAWTRVGKVIIPLLLIVLAAAYWFLYFYIPPKLEQESPTITPTQETATPSAKKATPSANKDKTTDWKVYKDNTYNFSIKYPSNWFIEDRGVFFPDPGDYSCQQNGKFSRESVRLSIHSDKSLECILVSTHGYQLFTISVSDSTINLNKYEMGPTNVGGDCGTAKTESIKFSGVEAVKITRSYNSCMGYVANNEIHFNHKGNGYSINIPVKSNGEVDPIYENILSTFKFTD